MKLDEFLNQYGETTRSGYAAAIKRFLSCISNSEVKNISVAAELTEKYFTEDRDFAKDVEKFLIWCREKYKPKTIQFMTSVVREFLLYNDVELSHKEQRQIKKKIPRGGAASKNRIPTREEIRRILHVSSTQLRAILLILSSSGLRINELLTLKIEDVDTKTGVITIRAEHAKNAHGRVAIISQEALSALVEWYAIRDKYVAGKSRFVGNFATDIGKTDTRVFPFHRVNANKMLNRALERCGLYVPDAATGISEIHFHTFRKFFVTNMKSAGCPDIVVATLDGHLTDLRRSYESMSLQDLTESYRRYEYAVSVYTDPKVKSQLISQERELSNVSSENASMRAEMSQMKQTIDRLTYILLNTGIGIDQAPKGTSLNNDGSSVSVIVPPEMLKNITRSVDRKKIT